MWAPNVIPREFQRIRTSQLPPTPHPHPPKKDLYWSRISARAGRCETGESRHHKTTVPFSSTFWLDSVGGVGPRQARMGPGTADTDRCWTLGTLLLLLLLQNFVPTHGSPSSYDLFQGSAHTGVVHRHRNR